MVEETIRKIIEPSIVNLGYELAEVSLKREKGDLYLHVIIDKVDPVSLDDIVKITDVISPLLDENDPISDNYILDVTSLGAEKPIKIENLAKYVGKYINVHVINPIKGENYIEGDLVSVTDELVTITYMIKTRKVSVEIKYADIDKARLAIKF